MANLSGNPEGPRRVSKPSSTEWWILAAALLASAALIVIALMAPKLARADDAKNKIPTEIPKLDGIWVLDKEHSDDPSKPPPGGGRRRWRRWGGAGGHHGGGAGGGLGRRRRRLGWAGHHHGGGGGEGAPPDGEGGGSPDGGRGARSCGQASTRWCSSSTATARPSTSTMARGTLASGRQADAPDTGGVMPAHRGRKETRGRDVSSRVARSPTTGQGWQGAHRDLALQRLEGESVLLKSRYTKHEGSEDN
jgi:hypothetical protein